MKRASISVFVILLVIGVLVSASNAAGAPQLTRVRVGIAPYAMFVLWKPMHELGIDHEFGIDFDIKEFAMTLPATQAMIQGSVDIVPSCHAEHVAAIKNAPNLISLSSLDLFKGFIFVGREESVEVL